MANNSNRQVESAFPGTVEEIPDIFVDNFTDQNKSAYFLSHFHGDHIVGLKYIHLNENAFIYASRVTVDIIKIYLPHLRNKLRILEDGNNEIHIISNNEEKTFNVIVVPADHSWGSVMFLFQYNGKNILFTGDFRFCQEHINPHLQHNGEKMHLAKMYVDTTFQNVPSLEQRSTAERCVAELVRNWLASDPEHTVEFLTSACFGYEGVCNTVFEETGFKTNIVDNEFNERYGLQIWDIYSQYQDIWPGITNVPSRISLHENRLYKGINSENETKAPKVLTIHFYALNWRVNSITNERTTNRIDVCYATHCARNELRRFINHFNVNPNDIAGFPSDFNHSVLI